VITVRRRICLAALAAWLFLPAASFATTGPDFDALTNRWLPLGCDSPDRIVGASPSLVSFAGDHANPPTFYYYDGDYLYFRYRTDADPSGSHGFAKYSWTALMQVPSGNRFRYQLSLNGKNDTIEIWRNTQASDIDFSPVFHDDAEQQLYTVSYKTGPLARRVAAGTNFHGQADYFVDFAFPVSTLIAKGVIASAADLSQSFFFPATSSNYSKSYLY